MLEEERSKAVCVGLEMLAGDENELITTEYLRHQITQGKTLLSLAPMSSIFNNLMTTRNCREMFCCFLPI